MDNRSNEVLFDEGIRKAKELVSGYIFDVLTKCCEELIQDALDNKSGFRNLTGNTITSYAEAEGFKPPKPFSLPL
jgi:hypothetical protein